MQFHLFQVRWRLNTNERLHVCVSVWCHPPAFAYGNNCSRCSVGGFLWTVTASHFCPSLDTAFKLAMLCTLFGIQCKKGWCWITFAADQIWLFEVAFWYFSQWESRRTVTRTCLIKPWSLSFHIYYQSIYQILIYCNRCIYYFWLTIWTIYL